MSITDPGDLSDTSPNSPLGNVVVSGGTDFTAGSTYTSTQTASNAGTTLVMATGATKVQLQNLSTGGTAGGAVIAFGATAVEAQAALVIVTNVSTAGTILIEGMVDVVIPPQIVLSIPSAARDGGYMAIGNLVAADNNLVRVTQGV